MVCSAKSTAEIISILKLKGKNMGLGPNWSADSYLNNLASVNPDPKKFNILRAIQIGTYLLVEVVYEGCTNFEGKKIMLYKNTTLSALEEQGKNVGIDPHFCDKAEYISPSARFIPTEEGWQDASYVALLLQKEPNNKTLSDLMEPVHAITGWMIECDSQSLDRTNLYRILPELKGRHGDSTAIMTVNKLSESQVNQLSWLPGVKKIKASVKTCPQ